VKRPVLRIPTRDARDADHMAIILIAGGLYLLRGRSQVSPSIHLAYTAISALLILSGTLLWLRLPAVKWLGALAFLGLALLAIRHGQIKGWSLFVIMNLLLPLLCIFWIIRIDYSHKFDPDTD
jgi:hypothetical protein